MTNKHQHGWGDGRRSSRPERRISVRSLRREPADYRKLARALIAIAEAEAAAQQAADTSQPSPKEVA